MTKRKEKVKYIFSRDMFVAYFLGHPENHGREFRFEQKSQDGIVVSSYIKRRDDLTPKEVDLLYDMYKEDVINGVLESF